MINLSFALVPETSFIVSRVIESRVEIVERTESGKEIVISSRKYKMPSGNSEADSVSEDALKWMPLFSFDTKMGHILTVQAVRPRKQKDIWIVDVEYNVFSRRRHARINHGVFKSVPFYGDRLFGFDDQGRPTFVRFETQDRFRIYSPGNVQLKSLQFLPTSLQMLLSKTSVHSSIPWLADWLPSHDETFVPNNEQWRLLDWMPPQHLDSYVRASISQRWRTTVSWTPHLLLMKYDQDTISTSVNDRYYLFQASQYPYALGCQVKAFGPSDVRFDLPSLLSSLIYRLDVKSGKSKVLTKGVLAIQI